MTLQAAVNFREYFRCYVIGQEQVRIMPYDPRRPHAARYVQDPPPYDPALIARVERDALTLCRALGYDLNTVEFAVEDGVPYAIDFMNPAPDAELRSIGPANFDWIVNAVADMAVRQGAARRRRRRTLQVGRAAVTAPSFTIGIEEEYQTVDPITFDLRSHIATEIVARRPPADEREGQGRDAPVGGRGRHRRVPERQGSRRSTSTTCAGR